MNVQYFESVGNKIIEDIIGKSAFTYKVKRIERARTLRNVSAVKTAPGRIIDPTLQLYLIPGTFFEKQTNLSPVGLKVVYHCSPGRSNRTTLCWILTLSKPYKDKYNSKIKHTLCIPCMYMVDSHESDAFGPYFEKVHFINIQINSAFILRILKRGTCT